MVVCYATETYGSMRTSVEVECVLMLIEFAKRWGQWTVGQQDVKFHKCIILVELCSPSALLHSCDAPLHPCECFRCCLLHYWNLGIATVSTRARVTTYPPQHSTHAQIEIFTYRLKSWSTRSFSAFLSCFYWSIFFRRMMQVWRFNSEVLQATVNGSNNRMNSNTRAGKWLLYIPCLHDNGSWCLIACIL